ncbi:MAG: hypothetical protein Q8Q20_04750, partial [bacterium]|nr:hypothetical protein [bacterium]
MRHGEQASENFIKYYSAKSRYEELIGQLQPDQSGEYNPELMQKAREAYDDYQAQDADRRTEAGERIKEKYLTEDRPGHDKKPDEALGTWDMLDLPPAKLNRAGLIVDKKGKFRIKNPNMPELPGAYVDQEVLKAFLLGLRDAQNTGAQWEVIQDVCEYLDVTVPEKPTEVEIKKNGGFLEALREKIAGSGAVEAAAILAVITIMLTMPRESGGPPIA